MVTRPGGNEGRKETLMYYAKWFKEEEDAKRFQQEHGGSLYKNVPRSRTRQDHLTTAAMMGFDPNEFRYSVNWTLPKGEFEY